MLRTESHWGAALQNYYVTALKGRGLALRQCRSQCVRGGQCHALLAILVIEVVFKVGHIRGRS